MAEFLKLMENWDGFASARNVPINEAAVARAVRLLENADGFPSHRHEYLIREAIATSDFPDLLGVTLDRELLAKWSRWVPNWRAYCPTTTVRDFNTVERHKVYGQDNYLQKVSEYGEYLERQMGQGKYTYNVYKRGARAKISWEASINDFLRALQDIPERFATAAISTVSREVTSLFAAAAGPATGLFGATITDVDGQAITNLGTLKLTIANLETTLGLMAAQKDPNGEPILVRGVHLVVPPALELTARSILTSALKQYIDVQGGAGATIAPFPTANVVAQYGLQLHVDPYLPIVDVSANKNTTWYVFADPGQGRAMEMAFLRGHEAPEICMKMSNKASMGGASIGPSAGDFDSDSIEYRVRIVCGGRALDPRFAYAQDGTT